MVRRESLLKRTTKKSSTEFGTLTDPRSEPSLSPESTSSDSVLVPKSSIWEVLLVPLVPMFLISSESREFCTQSSSLPGVEEI